MGFQGQVSCESIRYSPPSFFAWESKEFLGVRLLFRKNEQLERCSKIEGRCLMNLSCVIIFVANPQRCASFYRDNMGLSPIGEWSGNWAELDGGNCRLAFHQAFGEVGKVSL